MFPVEKREIILTHQITNLFSAGTTIRNLMEKQNNYAKRSAEKAVKMTLLLDFRRSKKSRIALSGGRYNRIHFVTAQAL
ncbi:hypothetical protein [Burkholderia sp. 22PA0106]|uniref:hypothetical protein n=1 Tax=Burkholderia sp. 22PA0106 TaxID=3237371 RepID=UPI0039C2D9ED